MLVRFENNSELVLQAISASFFQDKQFEKVSELKSQEASLVHKTLVCKRKLQSAPQTEDEDGLVKYVKKHNFVYR